MATVSKPSTEHVHQHALRSNAVGPTPTKQYHVPPPLHPSWHAAVLFPTPPTKKKAGTTLAAASLLVAPATLTPATALAPPSTGGSGSATPATPACDAATPATEGGGTATPATAGGSTADEVHAESAGQVPSLLEHHIHRRPPITNPTSSQLHLQFPR